LKKINIKSKPIVLIITLCLVLLPILLFLSFTKAVDVLDNGVKVEPDSELTYYLDISYDGVDRNINDSSNSIKVSVFSDYIYVEDKLPDGLIFQRFLTSEDGSVGSTLKGDDSEVCIGSVIDDTIKSEESNSNFHGLHYDESTRTVSFKIQNLQAGCHLTVGIVTKTPDSVDDKNTPQIEKRRDFFNTATAKEKNQFVTSNTVHAWMGEDIQDLYNVTYEYLNEEDYNIAPNPSIFNGEYAENTTVNIASEPEIEGYEFSGWRIEDDGGTPVISTNLNFVMPNRDVKLVGTFTKKEEFKVTYEINGDIPDGYILPSEKTYYAGQNVKVDSLVEGTIVNGYKFLGWFTNDVEISTDNEFEMPESDVVIYGWFDLVTYKVEYRFYDTVLPDNWEELLPLEEEYVPGETVVLSQIDDSGVLGYKFLGWYKEDYFEMPEEDIIIYGEWKEFHDTFSPKITKEVVDKKNYYKKGDKVKYRITVYNGSQYVISNVLIKEHNLKASFIEDSAYSLMDERLALIPIINPYESVYLYAEYDVTDEVGTIENKVEIRSASSDYGVDLDKSKDYIATASFDIWPELKISKKVSNEDSTDKVFQFHITSDKGYDSWLNLNNNEEQVLYLEPNDTYYVKEVVPQEYTLETVTGAISGNGESIDVKLGEKYSVEFINKHHRKPYYHSDGRVSNEVNKMDFIRIYFKAINGYFDMENYLTTNSFIHKNYVDEKYNITDLISLDIPVNENGEFILSSTDIPTSNAYAGYVDREFWQSIIPTKGMEVKNGDTFVVKYFKGPSNPSTAFTCEGSDISIRFVWNDRGFESERPKEATVILVNAYDYENYNAFDTVILNDENNWSYEWKGLEYSTWQFETSIDIAGHSDIYDVRAHRESDSDIVITYTYFALIDD